MTEPLYRGTSVEQAAHAIDSHGFRETVTSAGVTMAVAAQRLHTAAQHLDPSELEVLIATHRPELWKRMNKRPGRMARMMRRR
ncbi:hypothetical protein OG552_10565 [Streptomyces sp. NBC_01476]|uniref:hypothetical protein n=1 Tax=Streptomyces sp. NBC_01476 TaxID=2903881 RepID=UPI002E2F3189|nr:hypothetical protein [Streptomyces sp. NBC_01476]